MTPQTQRKKIAVWRWCNLKSAMIVRLAQRDVRKPACDTQLLSKSVLAAVSSAAQTLDFYQFSIFSSHSLSPGAGELQRTSLSLYSVHAVTSGKATVVPRRIGELGCIIFSRNFIHLLGILLSGAVKFSSVVAPVRHQVLDNRWQHGNDSSVHAELLQCWSVKLFFFSTL